jgi:hypothetical protein
MDVNGDLISRSAHKTVNEPDGSVTEWESNDNGKTWWMTSQKHPVAHPEPGTKCPTCDRRVNHPKKADSPTSKTFSYRVPVDEQEAHAETLDVAARYVGVAEQPFSQFKLIALALVLVLQDESLRGYAQRAA